MWAVHLRRPRSSIAGGLNEEAIVRFGANPPMACLVEAFTEQF